MNHVYNKFIWEPLWYVTQCVCMFVCLQVVIDFICSYCCRHIFVANSHNVFKLTPVPYEVQVQQLVQQQQYELAMQICVSVS